VFNCTAWCEIVALLLIRTCTALVFMVTGLEHAIDVCIYGNVAFEIPVYIRAVHTVHRMQWSARDKNPLLFFKSTGGYDIFPSTSGSGSYLYFTHTHTHVYIFTQGNSEKHVYYTVGTLVKNFQTF